MQIFSVCTDYRILIVAIVTFSFGILCGYTIQLFERRKWHSLRFLLNGLACIVGMPCEYVPNFSALRMGYAGFLLSCTVMLVVLSTYVTETYSVPYLLPQTQSVDDILNYNFRLAGDQFALMKLRGQITVIYTIDC